MGTGAVTAPAGCRTLALGDPRRARRSGDGRRHYAGRCLARARKKRQKLVPEVAQLLQLGEDVGGNSGVGSRHMRMAQRTWGEWEKLKKSDAAFFESVRTKKKE